MAEWIIIALLIGTAAVFYRLGQNQAYKHALAVMAEIQAQLDELLESQHDELRHVDALEAKINAVR